MHDKPGWIVFTEAIGCDPKDTSGANYHAWTSRGFGVIVRLNNGYYSEHHHPGTIPTPDLYEEFAVRCANFVAASDGCDIVIIGNETNMTDETPKQGGILPADYARCYRQCRQAIHRVKPNAQVLVAGPAPWNQQSGDWLDYWRAVLRHVGAECDGVSIHCYSHGTDPSLITSEEKVHGWHWHFRVYQDQLEAMPAILYGLPVYITETDQDDPWADVNGGWIQNAYAEIDRWNKTSIPAIQALCLFRSQPHDKWSFAHKQGVQDDFRAAVARGYQSPIPSPIPEPPWPPDPTPEPEPEPPVPDLIEWDPRLTVRGCELTVVEAAAGQTVWRCIAGEWFNEQQAQGRVNTYVTLLDEHGQLAVGVPVTWYWQSGEDTKPSEVKNDSWLGHPYSKDFAMYNVAPSYGVRIADGNPTDIIWGTGLGSIEQPDYKIHTAYSFTFKRMKVQTTPVPPTLPHTQYVIALAGANLRAEPVTGAVMVSVPYGEAVTVDESVMGSDGYQWHSAIYDWYKGWMRADLLSVQAPPEPEPPEPPVVGSGHLIWPVQGARITQRFGDRYEYYLKHFDALGHNGLDFGLAAGSPIYATADGIVTMARNDATGYGLLIRLYHPHLRLGSLYAHCSELLVSEGDRVTQGQQIAKVGSTGTSTGDHCHWELCAQDASGYVNVSYGHSKGRSNPEIIMWLMGMPPVYG
jgi:hypothetical protein